MTMGLFRSSSGSSSCSRTSSTVVLSFLSLLSLWTSSVTAAASESASSNTNPNTNTNIDHGKALMEWLKNADGGFFHPNLELRRQGDGDDSPFYGMFATDKIEADDVLLRIPRSFVVTPLDHYISGDRVVREFDGEPYHVTLHNYSSTTNTYFLIHDDGEREESVPDTDFYLVSSQCKTVQRLVQELALGNDSKLAPYVNYLNSQPVGQLPSRWSPAGQDLLLEIVGYLSGQDTYEDEDDDVPKQTGVLPPLEPLHKIKDYHADCQVFSETYQDAYLLLEQRGWDELMIPVFDMMSHGNGPLLNTRILGSVHDTSRAVTVLASRAIEKGEEIYTTYNQCEDCENRKLWYGTPELLRDYGFVERYPQRWIFEDDDDQDIIFDIDYIDRSSAVGADPSSSSNVVNFEDSSILQLTWVQDYQLTPKNVPFLQGQLQRLQDLGETLFAKQDPAVPDHEWQTVSDFRKAYVTALRMALEKAGYYASTTTTTTSDDSSCTTSSSSDGSCPVYTSTRYDTTLEQEIPEEWVKVRPTTCNDYKTFGVAFWEETEIIQTPYQKITYLSNPTFDPPDTCLMLDNVWQICTSYRPHYHEMSVHFTARFLDKIERVLFVGGGDSMLLHDILNYPSLKQVIGLEIDQLVTRSAFNHFGVHPHFDNDKVEWWFGDAAKSMLMLPTELYGTFDMVLVDLSETVVSLAVTKELDVLEALSLLIKPDGILLKNEYNYFPEQKGIFRDALHIHFYNVPAVCSQSLILGSNGVDFLRDEFKDHGVDHIYHWLDEPNVRYELARDYQKNNTNPQNYCMSSEDYKKQLTVQEQSPGITMIVEAEQASSTPASPEALKKTVESALQYQGFTVLSTVVSGESTAATTKLPVTVTILREGYVVARAWPDLKYVGYDIHLWSSFAKHEDAKKALIKAVGGTVLGPLSSSYRIVSGGMFGVSTWKEDEKGRGPKLDECDTASSASDSSSTPARADPDESAVLTAVEESMSVIVRDGSKFVVAVICGPKDKPCNSVDAVKKANPVSNVVALYGCAELVTGVEFMQDSVARMLSCEKSTWKFLEESLGAGGNKQKIRAIVVDSSAENAFVSVFQSICKSQANRKHFLTENMSVVAPLPSKARTLRKNFVDSFRKEIFPLDPSFTAEVYFNTTAGATVFEIAIAASGNILFVDHLVQYVEQVEKKTSLVAEISNIRGGEFLMQDKFEAKQVFTDADFDQATQLKEWEAQKPLGLQTLIQLGTTEKRTEVPSIREIKTALKVVMALSVVQEVNVGVHEFTEVGDGGVLAALWTKGHVVVLWDGRGHIDINLFTYEEDFDFCEKFEKRFLDEISGFKLELRDIQPRGMGHVVSFAKDLNGGVTKPRWV